MMFRWLILEYWLLLIPLQLYQPLLKPVFNEKGNENERITLPKDEGFLAHLGQPFCHHALAHYTTCIPNVPYRCMKIQKDKPARINLFLCMIEPNAQSINP